MNQSAEERQENKEQNNIEQNNIEQNKAAKWSKRKKGAVASVILALTAVAVVPVIAWFYYQRSMQTMTKINLPYALQIGEGKANDITQLELNNIDVTQSDHKDVVFCVFGRQSETYRLQLAHTTNIGFTYEIYPAKTKQESGLKETASYLGDKFYFNPGAPVDGSYLNQNQNPESGYANNPLHSKTYGNYSNVQRSAEPLYWQNKTDGKQLTLPTQVDDTGYYINYYVLRISWGNTIQNNKETDMIYLMAEATGSSEGSEN